MSVYGKKKSPTINFKPDHSFDSELQLTFTTAFGVLNLLQPLMELMKNDVSTSVHIKNPACGCLCLFITIIISHSISHPSVSEGRADRKDGG